MTSNRKGFGYELGRICDEGKAIAVRGDIAGRHDQAHGDVKTSNFRSASPKQRIAKIGVSPAMHTSCSLEELLGACSRCSDTNQNEQGWISSSIRIVSDRVPAQA